MKEIKTLAEGKEFKAADFGKLSELGGFVLPLGPGAELKGKTFGGQAVGTTGAEFSFQTFEPGQEGGFYHKHKNHEELYFFLSGTGEYQVDGRNIPVREGTVIRVSPEGKRAVRNNGTEPLVMLCVQYRGNSFTTEDATDGDILQEEVKC